MPAKDPEKRRATVRAWYARTKQLRGAENAARRAANRRARRQAISVWYAELKSQLVCPCGESHPACIQFHHRDPSEKDSSIADAVRRGFSRARILRELEKCEVLCANCHAKRHAREDT